MKIFFLFEFRLVVLMLEYEILMELQTPSSDILKEYKSLTTTI